MLRPTSLGQRLRATTALQAVAAAVLLAAPLAPTPAAAQLSPNARPMGGQVVAGQASIGQSAATTTINQSTQRAAVNWQSFDVGSSQSVQFQQPNASAVTLNRVVGPNPSQIAGKISANGQLVVVNQAGLVFDKGSQVNAAGLVVSAAGISNGNFMAGRMVFDQAADAGAKVENRGTITVKDEGLAALVAPRVRNSGKIQATMGTVILAGAEAETLDLYGDGLVSINVTKQVASAPDGTKALVTNDGVIAARGGSVVLTADAVDGVVQTLVDAGGRIGANSTASRTGRVLISGAGGDVRVEGVVTAQGDVPGSTGGAVKVSGSNATIIGAHTRISVSGKAGGGVVALGTTLRRAKDGGTGIAAATTGTLVVRKGATITADATAKGNGGRVVALASGSTTLAGTVTAKGGALGGNGGFVELSGGKVALPGHVDTTAAAGTTGMMLVDPSDVWVSDNQPTGTTPNVSWFTPATLEGDNTNITLAAAGSLNVATSYQTTNTLELGSHSLLLFGGTGLTIDRGFTIGAGSIDLFTQAGAITLNGASGVAGGVITAQQLAMLSPTAIGVPAGNTIIMSGAGGIALGAATLGSQAVPVNELDLSAAAGGITQDAAGAVFATTVRAGTVVGDVGLNGTGNQIANLPLFAVTGGDFSLVDSGALTATYVTANNVFLQVTGGNALTLASAALVSTGSSSAGRVSLVADTLNLPMTATVTGGTIEIAPSTSGVPVSILPATPPADTLTIDQTMLSRLQTTTLRVGGFTDVPAGTPYVITPTAGSITIASALDLTGIATTLDLQSIGPVTQNAALTVNTLIGNTGTVTLTDPGNTITNLGSFTAASFTLTDPGVAGALNVIGPVIAPTVALSAPDIDINGGGTITATTSTMLTASAEGGTIAEGGVGVINTGLLTGSAGGGVTLDGANDVVQLGTFSPGGNFLLNNGTNALEITGAFSGAGDTMTLNAGNITQSADGIVTAQALTGTATEVNLGTAAGGNQIATLGDFTVTGGDFILADGSALAVDGSVSANTIFLQVMNGNSLTIGSEAALNADPSTGLVTLVTDLLGVQSGGAITGGTVEIAPNTAGLPVSIVPSPPPADTLTIDQTALSAIDTTTLRIGAFTDAPTAAVSIGTPTAGSIDIASAVDLTGIASVLDLETTGAVTQAGSLIVSTLTGGAGPVTLTTAGNDIAYLGAFNAGGPFTLDNGANPLEIIGAFSGAGQMLTLNAGAITQSVAGAVTAGTLTGSASLLDLGTATNAIANIGPFTADGGFALNDAVPTLTVAGAISGGPAVTLVNTGSLAIDAAIDPTNTVTLDADGISQTAAGIITAGTLTGNADAGAADLGTAVNLVTNLDTFLATTGFTLNDNVPALTVTGPVNGGSGVALTDTGSLAIDAGLTATGTVALNAVGISQTAGGVIDAGTLTGSAGSGDAALAMATNTVTSLGPFGAGGVFSLLNGPDLTVIGNVTAGSDATISVIGAGSSLGVDGGVTIQSGAGNTVALSTASGDIDNAGNVIGGVLADLTAADSIDQTGLVTANAVSETAGDDIDHSGSSSATAGGITLTAGDAITQLAPGTIGAAGGAVTLIANGTAQPSGIAQEAGALIVDPTPGQTISLTSATGIAFAGTIAAAPAAGLAAPVGTVAFTALGGDITETEGGSHTGILSALDLAGSASAGSASLDAPSPSGTANQIVELGPFATSGAFTLIDGHSLAVIQNVTAGTNATLTVNGAGNALTVVPGVAVSAGGTAALAATGGSLTQDGTVLGGANATLLAGVDLAQNGMVRAIAGTATLTAGNDLTQSNLVTAGTDAVLMAINGTLNQNGVVTAANDATLTAANDLMQTGTVQATGGTASLTAGADLTQSNRVMAGVDAELTSTGGNIKQTGSIGAGTSAILTAVTGNLTDSGSITAPNIQLAAPDGMVTLSGTLIGVVPDPSLNPVFRLRPGTFPADPSVGAWIIGGNVVVAPSAQVFGAGGGLSELVVELTDPQGLVSFGNFNNQSTELYLNLGLGRAAGQIAVKALQVQYAQPGSAQLTDLLGTVGGFSGTTAASASFIQPRENANYQVNGCPIGSVNCFQFTTLSLPTINPLKDLEVSTPDQPDDILIILPDVGDRDY